MPDIILGEALDLLVDNRGKNPPFESSGVPVISAKAIKRGTIALSEARYISTETYSRWMPQPLRRNDVILTSEAPLGECALVSDDKPLAIAQRLYALRGRSGVLDSRFLFYAFQSQAVQNELHNRSSGTTVTGIRQPELLKVRIPAPEYGQQKSIAAVLGALDDKIAVNERIAATADELMRAHYVKLAEASEAMIQVGELGDLVRRTVPVTSLAAGGNYIGLEHMPRRNMWLSTWGSSGELASAKSAFQVNHILFGKLRPYFHKVGLALTSGVCSTDILVVRAKAPEFLGWLLLSLSSDEVVSHASSVGDGTRMPRIKWKDLGSFDVAWPGKEHASQLTDLVVPLAERIQTAVFESRTLATLRDMLLPQLMSGRLRVKDAEKIVEENV
ncbi:restriction endonuclease subunit S [Streptomyces sp. NBC_00523]|uniref:restriction endonuclease subunit S n=1 Tax=Streptomyces sp. NBC_00523 TaxID=2975765 RepID=UPI002E811E12|nr:restriction endonuclease subunit S [Streptomyces sp. NBC_00523]WUD02131.1 restriction endonuclease subunit S [Streptomyces sp. NBC_00523]